MTDRFLICLPFTLAQECPHSEDWSNPKNFSNDAHDPGGKTMCGIIQREYDIYRKHEGLPTQDVRKLSESEGHDIYMTNYWFPHCPNLAIGLDLCFFDTAVNMGTTEAIKVLQAALGIDNDGDWGPATQKAVDAANARPYTAIQAFSARRHAVYQMMSGFQYFGDDWTRRTNEIEKAALKMVASQVITDVNAPLTGV